MVNNSEAGGVAGYLDELEREIVERSAEKRLTDHLDSYREQIAGIGLLYDLHRDILGGSEVSDVETHRDAVEALEEEYVAEDGYDIGRILDSGVESMHSIADHIRDLREHAGQIQHDLYDQVVDGFREREGEPGEGGPERSGPGPEPEREEYWENVGIQYCPREPGAAGRVFVEGSWMDENIPWASNEPEITYMMDLPADVVVEDIDELEVRATENFFAVEDEETGELVDLWYDERGMETLGRVERPDIEVVARNAEGTMIKVSGLDPVTYDRATDEFVQMRAHLEGREDPIYAWDTLELPERTLERAAREKGGSVERVYDGLRDRYYDENSPMLGTARNLLTGRPDPDTSLGAAVAAACPLIEEVEDDGPRYRPIRPRGLSDHFLGTYGGHISAQATMWLKNKFGPGEAKVQASVE